jgi:hypothetical protein
VKGEGVETGVGDIKTHDIEHRKGEASGLGCQYFKGGRRCGQSSSLLLK